MYDGASSRGTGVGSASVSSSSSASESSSETTPRGGGDESFDGGGDESLAFDGGWGAVGELVEESGKEEVEGDDEGIVGDISGDPGTDLIPTCEEDRECPPPPAPSLLYALGTCVSTTGELNADPSPARKCLFSPSMTLSALRSASFSCRASRSSASVSARLMRSVLTILFAWGGRSGGVS